MKRAILVLLLVLYGLILIKVMVLKDIGVIRIGQLMLSFGGTQAGEANWIPFRTIWPYLLGHKGLLIAGINLIGNIILLVPVGFLASVAVTNLKFRHVMVLALASGFCIEGLQVILQVGIFDIDDVILNGLGVVLGYWLTLLISKLFPTQRPINVLLLTCSVVLAAAAISITIVYWNKPFPIGIGGELEPTGDLCRGTGGTGTITNIVKEQITIRRRDGSLEEIGLSPETIIRTRSGPASTNVLSIGMQVTVITDQTEDQKVKKATHVLVCEQG
ncbi:MAG: VanZ family protein, partial [Bacteroidota bacterium]